MTSKQQSSKRHFRSDRVKADRAIRSNPLVRKLKSKWKTLSPFERAEMEFAVSGGKNQRALARALGVDPGTIRRDLKLRKLSEEEKEQIEQGRSVNSVLKAAAHREKAASREQTVQVLAAAIIRCAKDFHFRPLMADLLLKEFVDVEVPRRRETGELGRIKRSRMNPAAVRRYTRPRELCPQSEKMLMDWLTQFLFRAADEGLVTDAANAARLICSRDLPADRRNWVDIEARRTLIQMERNSHRGAESLKSPQRLRADAEAAQQKADSAQPKSVEDPRVTRARAFFNGDPGAQVPSPTIMIRTIGEENQEQRQAAKAKAEARANWIRKEMHGEGSTEPPALELPLTPKEAAGESLQLAEPASTK